MRSRGTVPHINACSATMYLMLVIHTQSSPNNYSLGVCTGAPILWLVLSRARVPHDAHDAATTCAHQSMRSELASKCCMPTMASVEVDINLSILTAHCTFLPLSIKCAFMLHLKLLRVKGALYTSLSYALVRFSRATPSPLSRPDSLLLAPSRSARSPSALSSPAPPRKPSPPSSLPSLPRVLP